MKLAGAYINDDTYERLVALAVANNRALSGELQVPDAPAKDQPTTPKEGTPKP